MLRLFKAKDPDQVHSDGEVHQWRFKDTVIFLVYTQEDWYFHRRVTDMANPVAELGSIRPRRAAHKIKMMAL